MTTPTPPLVVPYVHLNGTSAAELKDQLERVWNALDAVMDAMKQAAPNGRDYYPGGPAAMDAARAQHHRRGQIVLDLQKEIEAHMEGIDEVAAGRHPGR